MSGEPGSGESSVRVSFLPPNRANPESWIDTPCGTMIEAPPKAVTTVTTDSGASGCAAPRSSVLTGENGHDPQMVAEPPATTPPSPNEDRDQPPRTTSRRRASRLLRRPQECGVELLRARRLLHRKSTLRVLVKCHAAADGAVRKIPAGLGVACVTHVLGRPALSPERLVERMLGRLTGDRQALIAIRAQEGRSGVHWWVSIWQWLAVGAISRAGPPPKAD